MFGETVYKPPMVDNELDISPNKVMEVNGLRPELITFSGEDLTKSKNP